jgi:hypothetical protein
MILGGSVNRATKDWWNPSAPPRSPGEAGKSGGQSQEWKGRGTGGRGVRRPPSALPPFYQGKRQGYPYPVRV